MVAGLIAGQYTGVASKANIVLVKSYSGSLDQNDQLDYFEKAEINLRVTQHCLEWIWQDIEANRLQGKAVINHSYSKCPSS